MLKIGAGAYSSILTTFYVCSVKRVKYTLLMKPNQF